MTVPPRLSRLVPPAGAAVVLALAISLCLGCTSRSAEEIAAQRTRVLGTWEYQTNGIRALERGTLYVSERDGELVARIQDRWRGQIEGDINLRAPRMELDLDHLRIRGRLEQGRFVGSVQTQTWSVSQSRGQRQRRGQFVARRVSSKSPTDAADRFGCSPLLWESSYACSPLGIH